jgi:hypothetical protein
MSIAVLHITQLIPCARAISSPWWKRANERASSREPYCSVTADIDREHELHVFDIEVHISFPEGTGSRVDGCGAAHGFSSMCRTVEYERRPGGLLIPVPLFCVRSNLLIPSSISNTNIVIVHDASSNSSSCGPRAGSAQRRARTLPRGSSRRKRLHYAAIRMLPGCD